MWERLPRDSVTDVSSYPARGQHFHLDGIAAARLLKDRGVFAVVSPGQSHPGRDTSALPPVTSAPVAVAGQMGWTQPHGTVLVGGAVPMAQHAARTAQPVAPATRRNTTCAARGCEKPQATKKRK